MRELVHRLGEPSVTAILEDWEHHAGLKARIDAPFEKRWAFMMRGRLRRDRP